MECAGVIFENDGKFFLQLRGKGEDINNPGKWGIFGGFTEEGETPEQTAIREIKEELNLNLTEDDLEFVKTIEHEGLTRHIFKSVYPIDLSKVVLNEGDDMKFFTIEDIFNSLETVPLLKPILSEHFR